MKLKTKLLPLVGISAAVATVAPIALTSCRNSGMVDLVSQYNSKITEIPAVARYSESDVNTLYFNAVKNNPSIFADDIYWYRSLANKILYSNEKATKAAEEAKKEDVAPAAADEETTAEEIKTEVDEDGDFDEEVKKDSFDEAKLAIANDETAIAAKIKTKNIYNVTTDNEKVELTDISKKTITIDETNYEVWLASFTEEFEIVYDEASSSSVSVTATQTTTKINTAMNVVNKGKIQFTDIPIYVWYNPGIITYGTSTSSKTVIDSFLAGLWGISIDERENYKLINYILKSDDYDASIKFNATSTENGVTTIVGLGSNVIANATEYNFTIDSDFSLADAGQYYYDVMDQAFIFGYSHYLWNIDCAY